MKQINFRQILHYLVLLLAFIIASGCEKTSDDPEPLQEVDPELLVYSLGIALVPEGIQEVDVIAINKNGKSEEFSVTIEDSGIATVTVSDESFTVKGVGYGTTKVVITASSGESKEIPVRIYNPNILETEELLITFSQTFESDFRHRSINFDGGSCWHPVANDGFKPLGSLGISGVFNPGYDPDGKHGVMVVKTKNGSDALAAPVDYTMLFGFNDGLFGRGDDFSFWAPVPPEGYKAMGIVVSKKGKPLLDDVVCVRQDLTIPGAVNNPVWGYRETYAYPTGYFSAWMIEHPFSGPHENVYLSTGTFLAAWDTEQTPQKPSVHQVMNVFNIELPMLISTPYQEYVPKLISFDRPSERTIPVIAFETLVPCTIINDSQYSEMDKISSSPFYRLERQVFYKLLYHNHNKTSVEQPNSWSITTGVAREESETKWKETGISISAEAGISFKGFGGSISTTVSRSMGYSTMTSISEFEQVTITTGVNIPPGKAGALWQRHNRFVLKRHNGTVLEPVKIWEFGINSFVTDEFPAE